MTAGQRARRDAIMSATIELLSTRDHRQIHMREIADSSGVALATVYRYYVSKELLYAHAVVAWGKSFGGLTKVQPGNAASDAERMQHAFRRTIKAYERWPAFYRLIAALEVTEDLEARQVFQTYTAQYRDVLRAVMVETHPDDAVLLTQMLLSTLGVALNRWTAGEWDIGQVYDLMHRAVDLMFRQPRAAD